MFNNVTYDTSNPSHYDEKTLRREAKNAVRAERIAANLPCRGVRFVGWYLRLNSHPAVVGIGEIVADGSRFEVSTVI